MCCKRYIMTEVLLSDKQMLKLAGKGTKLMSYPDIGKYSSINELFGNDNKIIILYLNEVSGDSMSGHWTCLIRRREGKNVVVEFDDSYSYAPDDELKWHSKSKQMEMGQDKNYLTHLLYQFSLQPNSIVEYNEDKLQSKGDSVATCGRFVALRCHFYKVPLKSYQTVWRGLKNDGYDLDEVAVYMSDLLNGSPIRQE